MGTSVSSIEELQSRARGAGYDPQALDGAVLLIGAGAIGQNTAQDLALSGVREIRLVDADRFELHNLTRSPCFARSRNVLQEPAKAPLCAEVLAQIATHPQAVVRYADAWIEDLGAAVFDGVSAVACCVDSLRARAYVSDRCRQLFLPMMEAGFSGAEITVGIYPPDVDAACWRCGKLIHDEVVSCRMAARVATSLGVVPAIQSAAAVVGGLQAEAVIQAMHRPVPEARRIWQNVRTGESVTAGLTRDPACRHRRRLPVMNVPVTSESPLLELLDVASMHLDGAIEIELPSPYVLVATCGGCGASISIHAPGHRFARNPRCISCGGPWQPVLAPPENPVAYISRDHSLAHLSCEALGLAPGDVVLAGSQTGEVALRLSGSAELLLTSISRNWMQTALVSAHSSEGPVESAAELVRSG